MPPGSWLFQLMAVVLTNELLSCEATFNVFISSSQLESYFRESPDFSTVQGFRIDIIRNGQSLVLEDGSLSLVDTTISSGEGSGEAPTPPTERQRRDASNLLTPMELPALPADVDAVVFSWFASTNVSYRLSLSGNPAGHFEALSSNISTTGFIPLEISDFSVLFPCDSSNIGTGALQVTLETVAEQGEELNVSFQLRKDCQAVTPTSSSSIILPTSFLTVAATTTMLPEESAMPISQPSIVVMETPAPGGGTTSSILTTPTPSSLPPTGILPSPSLTKIPLMPISSLLVEPTTTAPLFTLLPSTRALPSLPTITLSPSTMVAQDILTVSSSSIAQAVSSTILPTDTPRLPGTSAPPTESNFLQLLIIVFAPVVGALILSVSILCCSVCICYCCCKRKSKKHFNDDPADLPVNVMLPDLYQETFEMEEKKDEVPISLWMSLAWGSVSNLPAGIQGVIKRYSTDRRSLNILSTVSRGDCGCIVNGQLFVNRNDPVGGHKGVMMKLNIGFQKQYGHRDEITKFLEMATLR